MDVRTLSPAAEQLAYTFGPAAPLLRVRPGTVVEVDTEDCFAGLVRDVKSDGYLMSTGSARPLEDAYRVSQHDLLHWAAELTGLETLDAYQLVSQAGLAPAGNVVDPNYTMVAKMPRGVLGGLGAASAYEGTHARLRAIAGDYLAESA